MKNPVFLRAKNVMHSCCLRCSHVWEFYFVLLLYVLMHEKCVFFCSFARLVLLHTSNVLMYSVFPTLEKSHKFHFCFCRFSGMEYFFGGSLIVWKCIIFKNNNCNVLFFMNMIFIIFFHCYAFYARSFSLTLSFTLTHFALACSISSSSSKA